MPVEIRELVIRAIVEPAAVAGGGACAAPAGEGTGKAAAADPDLVQACVAEVMRQLRRAGEP